MPSVSPAYSAQSGFQVEANSVSHFAAGQIGDDVEMMDRAFDQHRVLHRVAEQRAPRHVLAHVGLVAAGDVVDPPELARADDPPQRRLVLVEAVTHRHRHLAARRLDLPRDADRAGHACRRSASRSARRRRARSRCRRSPRGNSAARRRCRNPPAPRRRPCADRCSRRCPAGRASARRTPAPSDRDRPARRPRSCRRRRCRAGTRGTSACRSCRCRHG